MLCAKNMTMMTWQMPRSLTTTGTSGCWQVTGSLFTTNSNQWVFSPILRNIQIVVCLSVGYQVVSGSIGYIFPASISNNGCAAKWLPSSSWSDHQCHGDQPIHQTAATRSALGWVSNLNLNWLAEPRLT